jgi:hypothetical protein
MERSSANNPDRLEEINLRDGWSQKQGVDEQSAG